MDKTSDGLTGVGVFCLAFCQLAAPPLLAAGTATGAASAALDTSKPIMQRTLNIGVSLVADKGVTKAISNTPHISRSFDDAYGVVGGRVGNKAVDVGYDCRQNPSQIGC